MRQQIANQFVKTTDRLNERQSLFFSRLAKYNCLSDSVFIIQCGEQLKEIEMEGREAHNIKSEQIQLLEELD